MGGWWDLVGHADTRELRHQASVVVSPPFLGPGGAGGVNQFDSYRIQDTWDWMQDGIDEYRMQPS